MTVKSSAGGSTDFIKFDKISKTVTWLHNTFRNEEYFIVNITGYLVNKKGTFKSWAAFTLNVTKIVSCDPITTTLNSSNNTCCCKSGFWML